VHSLVLGYFLVKDVRVFHGTIFNAGSAAGAFILDNIPGLLSKGDFEVTCRAFYTVYFGVCQNFYVRVPADLDQFG